MKLAAVFVALCFVLAVFTGCKKSEDNNDNHNLSSIGQMLVAGKWQMSAYTGTINYMGMDTTVDLFAQEDDCDKDDFVLYASNGTATVNENVNKCADDGQIESFTWALLNNDTRLALVDANPDTFDLEATPTLMKIKIMTANTSGVPVQLVWTYKNIR